MSAIIARYPRIFLTILAAGLYAFIGFYLHLWGLPLGTDARLWGLDALNFTVGAAPVVTPGFPILLGLLSHLPLSLPVIAQILNGAVVVLLPALIYGVAAQLGASGRAAALCGIAALLDVRLLAFGYQMQPDALAALALLLAVPLLRAYDGSPRRAALLALYCGAVSLLREHGLVLAVLVAGWMVLRPGPWWGRLLGAALVLLAVGSAPALAVHHLLPPWDSPWLARVRMATEGKENLKVIEGSWDAAIVAEHMQAHALGSRPLILASHALNALVRGRGAWLTVLGASLALLGHARGERLRLILPVATAFPTLMVLSQDRHVLVVVPAALALLASAKPGGVGVRLARVLGTLGVATGMLLYLGSATEISEQAQKRREIKDVASQVCPDIAPNDLLAGEPTELALFCPRRATRAPWGDQDPLIWKMWWVDSERPTDDRWEVVAHMPGYGYLCRWRPTLKGAERPCAASEPLPWTPYLAVPPMIAPIHPVCDTDPDARKVRDPRRGKL